MARFIAWSHGVTHTKGGVHGKADAVAPDGQGSGSATATLGADPGDTSAELTEQLARLIAQAAREPSSQSPQQEPNREGLQSVNPASRSPPITTSDPHASTCGNPLPIRSGTTSRARAGNTGWPIGP